MHNQHPLFNLFTTKMSPKYYSILILILVILQITLWPPAVREKKTTPVTRDWEEKGGEQTHSIHQCELLRHHDGVKGQETESRKLVLEAALFLRGKRAADVFPWGEQAKRNHLTTLPALSQNFSSLRLMTSFKDLSTAAPIPAAAACSLIASTVLPTFRTIKRLLQGLNGSFLLVAPPPLSPAVPVLPHLPPYHQDQAHTAVGGGSGPAGCGRGAPGPSPGSGGEGRRAAGADSRSWAGSRSPPSTGPATRPGWTRRCCSAKRDAPCEETVFSWNKRVIFVLVFECHLVRPHCEENRGRLFGFEKGCDIFFFDH